ncbi:MAG: alkaline phosphatase family protein [Gemmatimonadota bacterium]
MPVIILVADGARPDTLGSAMDRGELPSLAQLRDEGGAHTIVTAWPSVTGVAYTPFLLGRFPGAVGLPGLRWFDRAREVRAIGGHSRSYVGADLRHVDRDLDPAAPTVFELAGHSLGALNVISRGLPVRSRIGVGIPFVLRAAVTHFRGDVGGWLSIDRDVGNTLVRRIRNEKPRFVFAAFTGIDKTSHSNGHGSTIVLDAMRIVDQVVADIRRDAEQAGRWDDCHLWIVSDHGHSPVAQHDDLAARMRSLGVRTLAHPWVFGNSRQAAVMVSGNAMAHVYLELSRPTRPFWPTLRDRWSDPVASLIDHNSVDLAIIPHSATRVEVVGREARASRGAPTASAPDGAGVRRVGGRAFIERSNDTYSYIPEDGDPLGLGEALGLRRDEAYERTFDTDYPDSLVQIAHLCASERAGDVILSASRNWDFRERYEPIPHVSSHGALHRDHMLVPLILNRRASRSPLRTTDVMPSALQALGVPVPAGLDGESFL